MTFNVPFIKKMSHVVVKNYQNLDDLIIKSMCDFTFSKEGGDYVSQLFHKRDMNQIIYACSDINYCFYYGESGYLIDINQTIVFKSTFSFFITLFNFIFQKNLMHEIILEKEAMRIVLTNKEKFFDEYNDEENKKRIFETKDINLQNKLFLEYLKKEIGSDKPFLPFFKSLYLFYGVLYDHISWESHNVSKYLESKI